jgi:Raf kinase inhibitor-like YbhB/YbcL family protein
MSTSTITDTLKDTVLEVTSMAFSQNGHIPKKYSCEGENMNPDIEIDGFPEETKTIALIVEDHDAKQGIFDHWIVWNIPPNEPIAENSVPGICGRNSFGKEGYTGPCPPPGSHRYFFKAYALDTRLDLVAGSDKSEKEAGSDKEALREAMDGHIVAYGELMAHYHKTEEPV